MYGINFPGKFQFAMLRYFLYIMPVEFRIQIQIWWIETYGFWQILHILQTIGLVTQSNTIGPFY